MLLRVGNLVCDSRNCRCQKIMMSAGKKQQRPENELGDSSRNSSPTPQLGLRLLRRRNFQHYCWTEEQQQLYECTDFGHYMRL
jgi:hypothetical protein